MQVNQDGHLNNWRKEEKSGKLNQVEKEILIFTIFEFKRTITQP